MEPVRKKQKIGKKSWANCVVTVMRNYRQNMILVGIRTPQNVKQEQTLLSKSFFSKLVKDSILSTATMRKTKLDKILDHKHGLELTKTYLQIRKVIQRIQKKTILLTQQIP